MDGSPFLSPKGAITPSRLTGFGLRGAREMKMSTSALVDTGADFTLAPLQWLLEIDAPEVRWAFLRGLWSEARHVTLYLVDVHFENVVLPGIEVAGVEYDSENDAEIVLGRNALNNLILLLDGPREQADLLERRPLQL